MGHQEADVSALVDWYLNQLATHGLPAVLAVQAGGCIGLMCGAGLAIEHIGKRRQMRRDIREFECRINHPAVRAHYLNPEWKEDTL